MFLKPESLILFKLNKIMVVIGNKPTPRRPRIQIEKIYLQVIYCKMSLCRFLYSKAFLIRPLQFSWKLDNHNIHGLDLMESDQILPDGYGSKRQRSTLKIFKIYICKILHSKFINASYNRIPVSGKQANNTDPNTWYRHTHSFNKIINTYQKNHCTGCPAWRKL